MTDLVTEQEFTTIYAAYRISKKNYEDTIEKIFKSIVEKDFEIVKNGIIEMKEFDKHMESTCIKASDELLEIFCKITGCIFVKSGSIGGLSVKNVLVGAKIKGK